MWFTATHKFRDQAIARLLCLVSDKEYVSYFCCRAVLSILLNSSCSLPSQNEIKRCRNDRPAPDEVASPGIDPPHGASGLEDLSLVWRSEIVGPAGICAPE